MSVNAVRVIKVHKLTVYLFDHDKQCHAKAWHRDKQCHGNAELKLCVSVSAILAHLYYCCSCLETLVPDVETYHAAAVHNED